MKILLVEDEKKTSRFVKKALQEQGFIVDVCDNGDDGYTFLTVLKRIGISRIDQETDARVENPDLMQTCRPARVTE